jgi:hypothetical protein
MEDSRVEFALLTGLGLAAPAGLNAYIPLLVLALAAKFSDTVTLAAPYDLLSSNLGIGIILLLLSVELVVDKVPGLDHVNDLFNTVVRPAAGALLVLSATSDAVSINPILAGLLGIGAAGTVHAAKVTTRAASTTTTAGLFNPVLSFGEDVVAAVASIVAIFVPLAVLVFLIGFAAFAAWAILRRLRTGTAALPNDESPNLRR